MVQDTGRAVRYLREQGVAIVRIEQYYDLARELGDRFRVLERGEVVRADALAAGTVRDHLTA